VSLLTLEALLNPSWPADQLNVRDVLIGAAKGTDGNATIGASDGDFVPFARSEFTAPSARRVENEAAGSSS
jgi:hypothetical protein